LAGGNSRDGRRGKLFAAMFLAAGASAVLFLLSRGSYRQTREVLFSEFRASTAGSRWVLSGVLDLSQLSHVPIGIETLPNEPAGSCGGSDPIFFSKNETFSNRLTRFLHCSERYVWHFSQGIAEIRPSQVAGVEPSFLDRLLPEFRLSGDTLRGSLTKLHLALDPQYESRGEEPSIVPARVRTIQIRLGVKGISAREVLNMIASQAGASWSVDYPGGSVRYEASRITFWSANLPRWGVAANARRSAQAISR